MRYEEIRFGVLSDLRRIDELSYQEHERYDYFTWMYLLGTLSGGYVAIDDTNVDDEKIVGYIISNDAEIETKLENINSDNDNYLITSVAVDPEYRKRGIGSMLLNKLIEHLSQMSKKNVSIYLTVKLDNEEAKKLYSKRNFILGDVIESYYEPGIDGQIMSLNISK
jgi:ribosomal protein S18 acetylase RimI-like enzyme